jgi:hypothetical protein
MIDKIDKWYGRDTVSFNVLFCFKTYLNIINKNNIYHNINQHVLFSNLDLHGLRLEMPNSLIFHSDLSNCILYCKKNTQFSNCDLTNSIVYPFENNGLIFDNCNISELKFNVNDDIEPMLNGWHWEGKPPKLNSYWDFYTTPDSRRVIVMTKERIIKKELQDKYYKEPYDFKKPDYDYFDDNFKFDSSKQKILPELEYISNKT